MQLSLKRPIAFFDIESTGVNVSSDRIVEIAIIKVNPDQSEEVLIKRINPEIPIPLESSLIHGIYDEDIKDEPSFKEVATEVAMFLGDSDLAGYNSNKFDVPLLMEEFLRAGVEFDIEGRSLVDVQNIFHLMEQRTLKAAYKFYCEKDLKNAHSAEADVRATYEVLKAQIEKYDGADFEDKQGVVSQPVVNDVEKLHSFSKMYDTVDFAGRMVYNKEGVVVFNFGKHKGRPVVDIFENEPSYYAWMQQGDFPLYTKKVLKQLWTDFRNKKREESLKIKEQQVESKGTDGQKGESSAAPSSEKSPQKKSENRKPTNKAQYSKPKSKKSKPISEDMLIQLQQKFGK